MIGQSDLKVSLESRKYAESPRMPSVVYAILGLTEGEKPDIDVGLAPIPYDVFPEEL
jgi:hypothetical protein